MQLFIYKSSELVPASSDDESFKCKDGELFTSL